ncbi:uncharacterized protein LOC143900672 isoform X2 [Temnothorax americanus]|uniref:uncharacterized protein LOC143900672 isoform X2 n=1 Tax=Temnothorax americanus TaxID=1964332 RepID=UPI004068FA3A
MRPRRGIGRRQNDIVKITRSVEGIRTNNLRGQFEKRRPGRGIGRQRNNFANQRSYVADIIPLLRIGVGCVPEPHP